MCRLAMNRIHQQFSRNTLWLEFAAEFPSQMREKSGLNTLPLDTVKGIIPE